jgi:hypothetical protein
MGKIQLIISVVKVLAFLLSLWAVPALLIWVALAWIAILWLKIVTILLAVIWLALIRPWNIFTDPHFGPFVSDMSKAIKMIFFDW